MAAAVRLPDIQAGDLVELMAKLDRLGKGTLECNFNRINHDLLHHRRGTTSATSASA